MPLIRIAPKVGKSAPTGPLPPQHPQPQRPGSEPAPEQLATQKEIDGQDQPQGQPRQLRPQGQGQDRQDQGKDQAQDQDAAGQGQVQPQGQDSAGQGQVQPQGQDSAGQGQVQPQGQGVDGDVDQDADRGSDAEGSQRNREGTKAEVQVKKQKAGTPAKESADQEDAGFLANFLPFGVGGGGGPEPRDLSLEPAETDPGEGDGLGPGGDGGRSGSANQVAVELWDGATGDEEFSGPMGQPIGKSSKAQAKGQPVTAEDTSSERASFAGQELGRRSGQVRRGRTGPGIPEPQLPSVSLRPEPPKPAVPEWFLRRMRPPRLPRPHGR